MVKYSKGFTLVELFMALAILGVTMLFAVPSFVTIMSNNQISGNTSDFVSALQLAKAEAATRVNPVTICKSNATGSACVTGGDWQQGWIVFSDIDGDASVDVGEVIVLNHEALDPRITFRRPAGAIDFITYNPSGTTSITATQVYIICDDRGFADSARGILIPITGRGNTVRAADSGQIAC